MNKSYQALETKRLLIAGKIVVGIDPGKLSHQAVVQDAHGITIGKPFPFAQSYEGYHKTLPQKLARLLPEEAFDQIVFAVERSCNLWQNLCAHLHGQGYQGAGQSAFHPSGQADDQSGLLTHRPEGRSGRGLQREARLFR